MNDYIADEKVEILSRGKWSDFSTSFYIFCDIIITEAAHENETKTRCA